MFTKKTATLHFTSVAALLGVASLSGVPALAGDASLAVGKTRHLATFPQHDIEDQVFYFVLPDRFSDGNPGNNLGDPDDPLAHGGFDPADEGMYHGGDIQGLKNKLDYLEGMGVTAIWLTPILKNKAVQGDSAGYHGYWTLDFTRLDPHLGTNDEMKAFIDAAHARGMKVFFDIIVNHTADVIKYKECHNADGSYLEGVSSCEYKSKAQLAAGDGYTPFIPMGEAKAKVPGWLNYLTSYHNQGDSTFSGENSLNGDFFGLDDVNTEKPAVVAGMIEIYSNLISEWKPDGFRIDTVKHVNPEFWQEFAPAIIRHAREKAGIEDFTLFGEVFSSDVSELSFYTTTGKIPSVLDFAFQGAAAGVVASNADVSVLEELFAKDDRYNDSDSSANQLLTFLSNHDIGRFGRTLKEGAGGTDAELLDRFRLANALMFFSRGVPVLYYGDEQGFTGDGGDKGSRENMFPSRVPSYIDNDLIGTDATPAADNFDTSHPLYQSIARLSAIYKAHPVLRRGIQMARANSDDSGKVLTFSRVDLQQGIEYLLAFNLASTEKVVSVPAAASGYQSVHGGAPAVSSGMLKLTLPAMDFVIVKATGIEPSPVASPVLTGVEPDATVAGMLEVAVTAPELEGVPLPQYQVSFEFSSDGGPYQPLAVDNNAPYRLYWNTSALADGSKVTLKATMSNLIDPARSTEVGFTVDARSPAVELVYENANGMPKGLLYDMDGGVMAITDADPDDTEFTSSFDWGQSPGRTLVFADLNDPVRLEQPLVLDRNRIMQLASETPDGGLTAKVYLNSRGELSAGANFMGQARQYLNLEDGGKPPLPANVNVRGGLNGWGASPLEYLGMGTYRGSVAAKQGITEYKFADATWGKINLGGPLTSQGLTSSANPANLKQFFAGDGHYAFTLLVGSDSEGKRYLLHAVEPDYGPFGAELFLHGGSAADDGPVPFAFDGKRYRAELALSPGSYKVQLANADGSQVLGAELQLGKVDGGLKVKQGWLTNRDTLSVDVETAGNYRFDVEHGAKDYRLDVTQASLPGADQPPFGATALYVRGEITGDTLMHYRGEGIYEALVVLDPDNTAWGDDGVSAFKVADADWASVNLGAAAGGAVEPGVAVPLKQGSDANLTYAAAEGVYNIILDVSDKSSPGLALNPLGKDYLVVHYARKEGDYEGWGVHAWGDIAQGFAPEWNKPIVLNGRDDFGRFAVVPMTAASRLGVIVHKGDTKNTPADLFFTPSPKQRQIWILEGDATLYESEAAARAALSESPR